MPNSQMKYDDTEAYYVVHPLDDVPEVKRAPHAALGRLRLTPMVRLSLMALRGYLLLMILLVCYRVLTLAGLLGHQ